MNYRGFFEKRINRFVVQLKLFHQKGETTRVYIPNPGRLWELLYPGTELLLKKNSSANKYNYSIEAVYKEGQLVYLHTLKNNDLAEHLLKNKRIPGLEEFHIIKREVKSPITTSRFDFLLEKQGQRCYLEVKSCSLFQGDMAMFPDAPSERASRHLLELKELKIMGYLCKVLIIVQSMGSHYFLPEYHTDFYFAETFLSCRNDLNFHVVGSQISEDLTFPDRIKPMIIPWTLLEKELQNRGVTMALIELSQPLNNPDKEKESYPEGYYLHIGYANEELTKRMQYICRKRKSSEMIWDILRFHATELKAMPIIVDKKIFTQIYRDFKVLSQNELSIAPDFGLKNIFDEGLLYFKNHPLKDKSFVKKLLYYRMESPLNEFQGTV